METFIQLLAIAIFIGVTIAHYRKPRADTDSMEYIYSKIHPFSKMIDGVVYDPHKAHLLAYHFATFKQKFNGEMPTYEDFGWGNAHKFKQQMEKVAFKVNDDKGDENFFMLYWRRSSPDNPKFCIFHNKQDFLDEIYNHWGVELYSHLDEYLGCDEKQEATATA